MFALRMIVTLAWALAAMVGGSLLLFLLIVPLKASERPDHCLIGRVVYDQQTIKEGHGFIFTLPKDLSRDFIIAWNRVMTGSQIPVTSDSVSLYNSPPQAFRIAFFRKGCLTESFELSEVGFWKVVGEASGSKREI